MKLLQVLHTANGWAGLPAIAVPPGKNRLPKLSALVTALISRKLPILS
jgi:hypothetical protein